MCEPVILCEVSVKRINFQLVLGQTQHRKHFAFSFLSYPKNNAVKISQISEIFFLNPWRTFATNCILRSPWSNMNFLASPLWDHPKRYSYYMRLPQTSAALISPQKAQCLLTALALYILSQAVCKCHCACTHACLCKCTFRELHLYSKSSRQAGRVLAGPGAVKWALLAVLLLIGSTYPTLLSRSEPKSHSRCAVLWNPISFHNFNG